MKKILVPFRILYALYSFALFVALMIPVFLWSLLVLPFGRIRAGNLIFYACTVWADLWFFLIAIHHKNIYQTPPDPKASYIYVANHLSYLDSAIIPRAFRRPVRPLGKVEMARIPIFGFIYRNVIVTVDRSSAENRAKSVHALKTILKQGISALVFPEGTFNTTGAPLKSFYDGAFRMAIETGTPIQPVLLLDSYARMNSHSVFSLNPGRNRVLFMEPIPVEGLGPEDLPSLKQQTFSVMEAELIRQGAPWIRKQKEAESPGTIA